MLTFLTSMNPKHILFYSSVKTKKQFSYQEYYRTDIRILRDLGFTVHLSNRGMDFLYFWKYDIAFIYFYRYGVIPSFFARIFGKKIYFTGGIDFLDQSFINKKGSSSRNISSFYVTYSPLIALSVLPQTGKTSKHHSLRWTSESLIFRLMSLILKNITLKTLHPKRTSSQLLPG